GELLGGSRMTVGRARGRLAVERALNKEWQEPPGTPPALLGQPQRREQVATFLEMEPAIVTQYETIHREPLERTALITRIARRMTDENLTEADAKAGLRRQMEQEVQQRERERALRRSYRTPRPPKKTPEEQAQEAAESTRRAREHELVSTLERFVELLEERPARPWRGAAYTLADMVEALAPENRQEIPGLLTQAEAVIQ